MPNHSAIVRTIEDILGTNYLGANDANALAMHDVFTTYPNLQPYDRVNVFEEYELTEPL